jgi:hypothetical protein
MEGSFELPVCYEKKEILLPAQLHQYGYSYKIEVEVNGSSIFFERDEERNWRAVGEAAQDQTQSISSDLLAAIATSLEQLFA